MKLLWRYHFSYCESKNGTQTSWGRLVWVPFFMGWGWISVAWLGRCGLDRFGRLLSVELGLEVNQAHRVENND